MRTLAALAVLFLVAACQTPPPAEFTDAQKAQIEAEVEQIVIETLDAAKQANIEPILARNAVEPGICVMGMGVYDCQEVMDNYREAWTSDEEPRLERQEMDGQEIRVMAISPTVAVVGRITRENRAVLSNGQVNRASFAAFHVYVLEDGQWKYHSGQQASWPIEDEAEIEGQ